MGNRNFVLLWCAYAVSAMGDHLSEMAILKTQDALSADVDITPLSARMTFTFFVPFFLLAPLAGVLADRLPRRALMVAADVARCVIMFCFVVLIGWMQDWGTWGPVLPLLFVGLFAAVFSPARSALLPTLIRPGQLVRANGMISGLGIIATMAAAKIGGYLADHYAPVIAFRIDAGTFLLSAVLLMVLIPPPQLAPASSRRTTPSTLGELRAGFRYARSHKHVLELIAVASLVWFCGPLVNSVIPAIVRDVYHGSYGAMSNYRAFLGLGFILGAIIIAVLGDALRSEIAMTWGLFGIAGGIAVFASSVFLGFEPTTLAWIGAVGVVLAGMFAVAVMASFNSLLQRTVADRFRGRVFGVKDVCCTGALLLATGALGVPAWSQVDRWAGYILLVVAGVTFGAGLVTLFVRLHRGAHGTGLTAAENLNEFLAKFWWRLKLVGRPTVPRKGAVILTANHTCSADPLFLSAAVSYRPISFMVAVEFTNWPIVRFFLRMVECIPVKRDGRDTAATKHAIRHLRSGKALGIFIEGRIVPPGETVEPKDGVAMLALKTGAEVIPAHISGVVYHDSIVRGLLARHRARVHFGRPVDLSEFRKADHARDAVREATRKIHAAILALAPSHNGENADGVAEAV
ncbi:MAG: MFS transporter [Phycisphaerales bacterium]|nr:MAG: MFS transporter [Phycisphaerales bacterium]